MCCSNKFGGVSVSYMEESRFNLIQVFETYGLILLCHLLVIET